MGPFIRDGLTYVGHTSEIYCTTSFLFFPPVSRGVSPHSSHSFGQKLICSFAFFLDCVCFTISVSLSLSLSLSLSPSLSFFLSPIWLLFFLAAARPHSIRCRTQASPPPSSPSSLLPL